MAEREGPVENVVTPAGVLEAFGGAFRGARVLVTGHTGFKGAWLCEWLLGLRAEVTGLSLPPPTPLSLFSQLGLDSRLSHKIGDIRSLDLAVELVNEVDPAFIFHLAAQPLVRLSYEQPVETFGTNVMGTVNLLEAVRRAGRECVVVVVTTDKCYENREWLHGYRENDPLGGADPYSSSKAAAELVVEAYRRSYFSSAGLVRLASARAGNVLGGGDWALDRIMPDCVRSLSCGQPVRVRSPHARRPWQHVLDPLSGYLWLAARLADRDRLEPIPALCSAFNFGPSLNSNRTVAELVAEVIRQWPGLWENVGEAHAVHEATLLSLATDKAHHLLQWTPIWGFSETIRYTIEWYRATHDGASPVSTTQAQLKDFTECARRQGAPWSAP